MERHRADPTKAKDGHGQSDMAARQPETAPHKSHQGPPGAQDDDDHAEPFKLTPAMLVIPGMVLGTLIAFGAVPRYFQHEALINHTQAQLSQAPAVSYVIAQPSEAVQEFVLPGSTEPIQRARVYSRVDGYLRLRNINIGDRVHKGQVLAEVATPDLDKQVQAADNSVKQAQSNLTNAEEGLKKAQFDERTAEANVKKAKSDMEFSRLEFARYDGLAKTGAVSNEQRDTQLTNYKGAASTLESSEQAQRSAAAAVKVAAAAVKSAQAAVGVAQSTRDQYAATQGFKEMKAKFDGVVTVRNVDPGALITSGSTSTNTILFELAKIDVLRIFAYVPEQYITAVHVGQTARLTFQAFPNESFLGTVTYVAGGLDDTNRTLQVEIHVPNDNGRLMPGMYAQVHFQSPSPVRLPIIPGSAVQFISNGCFVYTVDNNNRVHRHKVEVAKDLGGQVEISNGVAIGDKVIVTPPDDVVDGAQVNPVAVSEAQKHS
jgi:RND family efflux transporter MFP subunit